MRLAPLLIAMALLTAACAAHRPKLDPFSNPNGLKGYAAATVTCANEKCNVVACQTDEDSNCKTFAMVCLKVGGSYTGSKSQGQCTFSQ